MNNYSKQVLSWRVGCWSFVWKAIGETGSLYIAVDQYFRIVGHMLSLDKALERSLELAESY